MERWQVARDGAAIRRAVATQAGAWGGRDRPVTTAGLGIRTVNPVFLTSVGGAPRWPD